MKKFRDEEEWRTAVNEVEWRSRLYPESTFQQLNNTLTDVKHCTNALKDALFLLKLAEEKIEEHNGICKQKAGQMKQISYKRNNIEGWS